MRAAPLALLLAVSALDVANLVPPRWLHNPRARTAAAIDAWRQRDYAAADRGLEQALELAGETPPAVFNAGTGRLGAGMPGAALPLLSRAATLATADPAAAPLRPEALYNLGNAHLGVGDPVAAAESYRAALRLRPDHAAAKHNLELALREVQRKQQEEGQQQQEGGGGDDDRRSGGGGQQGPPQGRGGDGDRQRQGAPPPSPPPEPGQGQAARSPRLPSFNPQRDMSAEQAAALLESVENLEREQRRAQAEQQRRQRAAAAEKDW